MFLQVCVILFMGGYLTRCTWSGVYLVLGGVYLVLGGYTPDQVHPPQDQVHPPRTRYTPPGPGRYDLRVGSTHPTGMHSCFHCHAVWEETDPIIDVLSLVYTSTAK